ncbi:MAG: potassium transporter TrkG [Phycisphaerae bacterium]
MSAMTDTAPRASSHDRADALTAGLALLGVAALLARDESGAALLPRAALWAAQLPAIAAWLTRRCGLLARGDSGSAAGRSLAITSGVFLLAGVAGAIERRLDVALAILTLFVAGQSAVDWGVAWARAVAARASAPRRLAVVALVGWLVVVAIGTAVLATPAATISGVPDYRHNFWRHVSFCAQSAVSAAALVGVSGYDLQTDYSPFGCAVLYGLMQIGGAGVAALGLVAIQPLLGRPLRLATVLKASLALQAAGAAVMLAAWRAADAPDAATRLGWSLFHSASALLNCGLCLKAGGLASYLSNGLVFVAATGLMLAGSIGLAPLIAALGWIREDRSGGEARRGTAPLSPAAGVLQRTISLEFAAAFWLLVVGAVALFFIEAPGVMPPAMRTTRPLDLGPGQVPLFDMRSAGARWKAAVFLSANARSAGFAGVPLAQGAISGMGLALVLLWMAIGGSTASFAGGLRTTTVLGWFVMRFGAARGSVEDGLRRRLLRRLRRLALWSLALPAAAAGALFLLQDATAWERVVDGASAGCGVGWTTGLAPHLTWAARLAMIGFMLAGRLVPLIGWCGIASELSATEPPRRNARR